MHVLKSLSPVCICLLKDLIWTIKPGALLLTLKHLSFVNGLKLHPIKRSANHPRPRKLSVRALKESLTIHSPPHVRMTCTPCSCYAPFFWYSYWNYCGCWSTPCKSFCHSLIWRTLGRYLKGNLWSWLMRFFFWRMLTKVLILPKFQTCRCTHQRHINEHYYSSNESIPFARARNTKLPITKGLMEWWEKTLTIIVLQYLHLIITMIAKAYDSQSKIIDNKRGQNDDE